MKWCAIVTSAALAAACASVLQAQQARASDSAQSRRFIETTRAATARYRDASNATADGYHRVGVAFPTMGEHWINLRLIMENRFDPARPTILIYLPVDSSLRLAGVGYTALLERGQSEPDFPLARGHWHEHNGSVTDESLSLDHHALRAHFQDDELRLLVLHAWVWSENPDGVFVTDNWQLPLEAGALRASRPLSRSALRAIGLSNHGTDYVMLLLRRRAELDGGQASRAEAIVRKSAADIRALLPSRRGGTVDATTEARLATAWHSMWTALATAFPAKAATMRALDES